MNSNAPKVVGAALALVCASAVHAQQTLTFSNTDADPVAPGAQPLSVTLLAGSNVSIAPDGSVAAQCALTGGICTGLSTGGGPAPTVSLATGSFSAPPTDGRYPAGTSFLITPTVTGAEICVRNVGTGTPGGTNWPATVSPPFAAQSVQMLTGDATYVFGMRCYGTGGATTFTLPPLQTAAGSGGSCAGFTPPLPAGWVRSASPQQTNQVQAVEAPGQVWDPFPNSGYSGYLITSDTQYLAVEFNTPAAPWQAQNRQFFWQAAQQQGEADMNRVYVSISSCPGDFRIPVLDSVAPVDDPTFAAGCRSVRRALPGFARGPQDRINYQIGTTPANEATCSLAPGRTYYINFIRADARDDSIGTPAQEATCLNPSLTSCGVQMRYY